MRVRSLAPVVLSVLTLSCGQQRSPAQHESSPTTVPGTTAPTTRNDAPERKIVYNGALDLAVPDLAAAQSKLQELVTARGGFVAGSDVSGLAGGQRVATWKLRVPVNEFQPTLDAIATLGQVASIHSDSSDVTGEYYDAQARLGAKETEEKRLLHLLDTSTGKLEEVLAVERELSRVRTEADEITGRIKLLGSLADLSSITVVMTELSSFLPVSVSFSSRMGRTLLGSLQALFSAIQGMALVATAILPWILALLLSAAPFILWRRRTLSRRAARHGAPGR